eukprot:9477824-Pyramimonas_sp.AAC.1
MSICAQVAEYQVARGRMFLLEHPESASSWELQSVGKLSRSRGVDAVAADQCAFGSSATPGTLSKNPTRFLSN